MKYLGLVWAGVYVEDLRASVSFYQDILGLPLLAQGEQKGNSSKSKRSLRL